MRLQLDKFAFKRSVLFVNKGTAVEEEGEYAKKYTAESDDITCSLLAIMHFKVGADQRGEEVGSCVKETVAVVNLVI